MATPPQPTIGVFDSGFGGLTVLRALLQLLPNANYIYLGDTARLPYGSKSRETIARYAVSSARFLQDHGAELLVVACNTATALALDDIKQSLSIPVIGVVEPGAQAALNATDQNQKANKNRVILSEAPERAVTESNGAESKDLRFAIEVNCHPESSQSLPQELSFRPERSEVEKSASLLAAIGPPQDSSAASQVLVLATAATVQSHAYTQALNALNLEAHEKACPLLVPLVEEGWINHPVTDEVLRIYLTEALNEAPNAQTLLLGCTHYPLLEPAIHRILTTLGHPLTLIDSARATAQAVVTHLTQASPAPQNSKPTSQNCLFYATDSIEKFERLGSAFLGQPVTGVRLVDLGG
jgi:glutamate racemase